MSQITIDGLDKVMRKLDKLAQWSDKDYANLLAINERVADVYVKSAQTNVKDFDRDILVQRSGSSDILVKRGQLRRSLGIWQPERRSPRVMAGPRTNTLGRRKTRKNADGWFAHIVEGGDSFGIKKTTPNTGVFDRSKRATESRQRSLLVRLLKAEYEKFMR